MSKPKLKTHQNDAAKNKEPKDKDKGLLVGRVKKVIKKSRHKLTEEKFEKELRRTIEFLEQLQAKLDHHQVVEPVKKAEKKLEKKAAKKAAKAEASKKVAKKPIAKSLDKKNQGAASKSKSAALAAASPAETPSTKG